MHRQSLWIALVGVAIVTSWSNAAEVAGQSDREFDEQIHKMRQRAKELDEAGHSDQAVRVEKEIGRLQEQSRRRLDQESGDRSDSAEAKQRLAALEHRLAELKEQGRGDEAERIARQAAEIRQHLERTSQEGAEHPEHAPKRELEDRLAEMKRRIAEMKEAGRNEEADRLAQEAREMMRRAQAPQGDEARGRGEMLAERIGHIRQAARHLHAAGLHDVADNLMRQAEQFTHEVEVARQGPEAQRGESQQLVRRVEELSRALRDTRQRMERMEKQLQEISERIEQPK